MTGATATNISSGGGDGGSSVNCPTLTTPTLTPTTLRNIDQIFAESDPHAPPYQHENAAGFVPPIISPTSGAFSPVSLKPSNNHINSDVMNTPDCGALPLLSPSRHNSFSSHLLHPSSANDSDGPIPLLSPSAAARQFQDEPLPLLSPSKQYSSVNNSPSFLANLPPKAAAKLNFNGSFIYNNGGKSSDSSQESNGSLDKPTSDAITSRSNGPAAISRPQTLSIPRPVSLDLSCPRSNGTTALGGGLGSNVKISRPQTLPLASTSTKPKFVLPPPATIRGEPPGALTSPRQDLPPSPQTPLSIFNGLTSPVLCGLASPSLASLTAAGSAAKSPTSPSLSHLLSLAAAAASKSQYSSATSPRGSGGLSFLSPQSILPPGFSKHFEDTKIKQEEDKAQDLSISRPETPQTSPPGGLITPTGLSDITTPTGLSGLLTPTGLSSLPTPTGWASITTPTGFSTPSTNKLFPSKSSASDSGVSLSSGGISGGQPKQHIEFLDKVLKAAVAASPILNTPTSAMLLSPPKDLDAGMLGAISPSQQGNSSQTIITSAVTPTNNQSFILNRAQGTLTLLDIKQPVSQILLASNGVVGSGSNSHLATLGSGGNSHLATLAEAATGSVSSLQIPSVTVSHAEGVPASLKKRSNSQSHNSLDLDDSNMTIYRTQSRTDSANSDDKLSEDMKKVQRRERNKLAAARCRKRRLDLTNQLQDEVTEWEQRVRSLKQHLIELEQDKKRLESILTRHKPCKYKKSE